MRNKRPFRSPSAPFWQPPAAVVRDETDPAVELEQVRRGGGGRAGERERDDAERHGRRSWRHGWIRETAGGDALAANPVVPGSLGAAELEDIHDEPVRRVGGGRWMRRDLIAFGAGLLFLVGALLKPWGGGAPRPPEAASPAPLVAEASPSAEPSAEASRALEPPTSDAVRPWSVQFLPDLVAVDWSGLAVGDSHSAWGVATAVVAPGSRYRGSLGSNLVTPEVAWTGSAKGTAGPLTVQVPARRQVFALAITWPANLHAVSVQFEYLGNTQTPNAGEFQLPSFTTFDAIPVDVLLVSPAQAQLTQRVPSGRFWVTPLEIEASTAGSNVSPWQSVPWPWPLGEYRVTIALSKGSVSLQLHLVRS